MRYGSHGKSDSYHVIYTWPTINFTRSSLAVFIPVQRNPVPTPRQKNGQAALGDWIGLQSPTGILRNVIFGPRLAGLCRGMHDEISLFDHTFAGLEAVVMVVSEVTPVSVRKI